MTERLFEQDSYCRRFTAVVESCEADGDAFRTVLNRTAFFPEGGGQSADLPAVDPAGDGGGCALLRGADAGAGRRQHDDQPHAAGGRTRVPHRPWRVAAGHPAADGAQCRILDRWIDHAHRAALPASRVRLAV